MHKVLVWGSAPLEWWHLVPCWPAHCYHTIVTKHPVRGHLCRDKGISFNECCLNGPHSQKHTQKGFGSTSCVNCVNSIKTFMSVPPCALCLKAPNGYVPLAGFRSERAEIAFSPLAGGSQPSHFDSGSSLKLLYLRRDTTRDKY